MPARDQWWRGAVGYQIYPRSFLDTNGDGVGDLEGIRRKLPYLQWLGVDAVWVSPFFPSPGFDHGYDVSDYKGVSDLHGSSTDFSRLVSDAKDLGLRLMVDIVPNHTSAYHPWFREAVKNRHNPFRDYYIWKDPAPDGGPPNNWVSHFGGPAWTLDPRSGQYYCHLFLPEQPDLNWESERVRLEFDEILRYWCDLGVDGFRIDVAHGLGKDPQFRDNPLLREIVNPNDPRDVFTAYDHAHDLDQDHTIEIFERWNRVVAPYGAMLMGETGPDDPHRLARYSSGGTALHTGFYLTPVWLDWEPDVLLAKLRAVRDAAGDGTSWVIENHDNSRSATRYGGGARARHRSLAVTTFLLSLGGVPFIFQGQELGLEDGEIDPIDYEDPIATRNTLSEDAGHDVWGGVTGRDGCRTAMPWDGTHQNGFTEAPFPWLRSAPRSDDETVAGQRGDPASFLHRHRELLALRRSLPQLWESPPEWIDTPAATAAGLLRRDVAVIANLGDGPIDVRLDGRWRQRFTSRGAAVTGSNGVISVPPETTAILQRAR